MRAVLRWVGWLRCAARVSLAVFGSLQRFEAIVAYEALLDWQVGPPARGQHERDAVAGESADRAAVAWQLFFGLLLGGFCGLLLGAGVELSVEEGVRALCVAAAFFLFLHVSCMT